jgi:RHS repeat-associated protein
MTNRFDYDGWALIGEKTEAGGGVTRHHYFHGPDLSGTLQGAGTIGGVWLRVGPDGPAYFSYDGNGNVSELVDATGDLRAHYEYAPFGGVTAMSGDLAAGNPIRFSTKRQDEATGLLYYGYRDLDTVWGRWLSRDPIADEGGQPYYAMFFDDEVSQTEIFNAAMLNLYSFVENDAVDWVDVNGLWKWYGKWGGPNWTGGKKGSWPVKDPEPPIDNQDKCYQDHDICYGNCRSAHPCDDCNDKDHKKRSGCFRDCDRALSACLYKLINSKDPSANWKAKQAAKYFSTSNPGPDC